MQNLPTVENMKVEVQKNNTFIVIQNIFESREIINTALVRQSPQKQLLLSFIYFYGVYFCFIQIHIFIAEPGFAFIFTDGINFLFHPAASH